MIQPVEIALGARQRTCPLARGFGLPYSEATPTEGHYNNCVRITMINYTVSEVAQALGVSVGSVYNLCARRRIRHQRIGLDDSFVNLPPVSGHLARDDAR